MPRAQGRAGGAPRSDAQGRESERSRSSSLPRSPGRVREGTSQGASQSPRQGTYIYMSYPQLAFDIRLRALSPQTPKESAVCGLRQDALTRRFAHDLSRGTGEVMIRPFEGGPRLQLRCFATSLRILVMLRVVAARSFRAFISGSCQTVESMVLMRHSQ
jgi:hypothetical protein